MASVRKKKSQVKKFGAAKAPWVVYWRDVNGNQKSKSFPAGERGKREAKAFADKVDAEQKLGIQNTESDVSWARFRREYEEFKKNDLAEEFNRQHAGVVGPLRTSHRTAESQPHYAAGH